MAPQFFAEPKRPWAIRSGGCGGGRAGDGGGEVHQMIRLVMTASSVMSIQVKPAAAMRASSVSKFPRAEVSMPRRTEPKLRADFFRYSKREMSSSGPRTARNSRRAPGRCGRRRM